MLPTSDLNVENFRACRPQVEDKYFNNYYYKQTRVRTQHY
jgi:hypothetical protein